VTRVESLTRVTLSLLIDGPEDVFEYGDESSIDADDDLIPAANESSSSSEDELQDSTGSM